jgi:hypothetical protein
MQLIDCYVMATIRLRQGVLGAGRSTAAPAPPAAAARAGRPAERRRAALAFSRGSRDAGPLENGTSGPVPGGPITAVKGASRARAMNPGTRMSSWRPAGLRDAIASVLPGASWQRCRAHCHRNLLTRVPKSARPWASTLVRTIFGQPDVTSVRARHAQVVTALEAKFPKAATHLDDARDDILAFHRLPPRGLAPGLVR